MAKLDDKALDIATKNQFDALAGRLVRRYGKERAFEMMRLVTEIMVVIGSGRDQAEVRDMQVDIFNAVSSLHSLAQQFAR